ncbi:MAG TPA: hypothetical protein VJN96_01665 [Vicinamibacterales bacterium]|nr:hypothetical protein [Vicinamibacterales bacterium]
MTLIRRILLFVTSLAAFAVLAIEGFALAFGGPAHDGTQVDEAVARQQVRAMRSRGLHAAAQVTGSFRTQVHYPSGAGPANLKELGDLSDAIVTGTVLGNICRPISMGTSVATLYRVKAEEVLKGPIRVNDELTLAVIGGRIGFEDGVWVQLDTPGLWRPAENRQIALFLQRAPAAMTAGNEIHVARAGAFVPTNGALGMYDLSGERGPYVAPAGDYKSVLAQALHKEKLLPHTFLERIREATAQ